MHKPRTIRMMDKVNQLINPSVGKPYYADIKCVRMRGGVMFGLTRESDMPVKSDDHRVWVHDVKEGVA